MRWSLILLVACGGSSPTPDAGVCIPEGAYAWPAECAVLDCHARICDVSCEPGTQCGRLDCTDSPQCRADCQPQTTCELIDCTGAELCFANCSSPCLVQCTAGASSCQVQCVGAARVDCGNGLFACNRACP